MALKKLHKKLVFSGALVLSLSVGALLNASTARAETVLSDVNQSYAKQEIQALLDAGILSGYGDGTFAPGKPMTRAELAKVLVLTLGLKEDAGQADRFADIPKDAWYKGFVGALVKSGITDGTSPTAFSPDQKVSRQQLAVFFVRAMGLEQLANVLKDAPKIADEAQVSDWAYKHVALSLKIGFFQGTASDNGAVSFNPNAQADRQSLARLSYEAKFHSDTYIRQAEVITKAELLARGAVQPEKSEAKSDQTPPVTTPIVIGGSGGGSPGGAGGSGGSSGQISTPTTTVPDITIPPAPSAPTIVPQALRAVSNTVVEVDFSEVLGSVSAQDFVFDNGLTVLVAELKQGSDRTVKLTTVSQASKSYRLAYKGTNTGLMVSGITQDLQSTTMKVLSASVTISGHSYPATINANQDIQFNLPASLSEKSMFTHIVIQATEDTKTVNVTYFGFTRTVNFINGVATISVSQLLGPLDPEGDGVSVATIRSYTGTQGFGLMGTLGNSAGATQNIQITIK